MKSCFSGSLKLRFSITRKTFDFIVVQHYCSLNFVLEISLISQRLTSSNFHACRGLLNEVSQVFPFFPVFFFWFSGFSGKFGKGNPDIWVPLESLSQAQSFGA